MGEQQAPSLVERLMEPWSRIDGAAARKIDRILKERKEAAARITELEGDLKAAFREISKLAREAGEAKGRLAMSEAAGIVDGWRERAERAEARCRVLQDALAPFAEAARLALIGGYPPVNFVGAVEFEHAAQALSLSGGGEHVQKLHELEPAANHPEKPDNSELGWRDARQEGARGGEPVAWRLEEELTGTSFYDYKPDAEIDHKRFGGVLTPLYASPAEPSGWRPIDQAPDLGRKIVALFGDGSGASMFWRHDGGHIDAYGDEWGELHDHYALWTYLPDSFQFWCEYRSDEPMTLTLPPTSEGGGA